MSPLAVDPAHLPKGWVLRPLKAVARYMVSNVDKVPDETEEPVRLCNYTDVYKNEFIRSSMDFMRSTATEREIDKFRLQHGDVIITKDSETWEDIAVPSLVVESANDLVCGYHLAMLRPVSDQLDGRFLFRCLQSKAIRLSLELASTGITRFGLSIDDIGRLQLPIPPRLVQQRIADYLDRETAEIDALIAEKERMLGLLEEKRAALVTHAVTRGLDPHAPLKPSGLAWLGDIPAHWKTKKFNHCVYIAEGQVDPEETPYRDMPLIAPNHIESTTGRLIYSETASEQAASSGKYLCEVGDVIYSKIRPALRKAVLCTDRCLCSADMYPLRCDKQILPQYLLWFILSEPFSAWAVLESDRVAMPKINRESLHDFRLSIPPLQEQATIVFRLGKALSQIDNVRMFTFNSTELLRERRSALITAAVTGQIPVEEMAT